SQYAARPPRVAAGHSQSDRGGGEKTPHPGSRPPPARGSARWGELGGRPAPFLLPLAPERRAPRAERRAHPTASSIRLKYAHVEGGGVGWGGGGCGRLAGGPRWPAFR